MRVGKWLFSNRSTRVLELSYPRFYSLLCQSEQAKTHRVLACSLCDFSVNQILFIVTLTDFLVLPLVVLWLRTAGPKWFTGPVALCAIVLLGWVFVNASLYFYFETLGDWLRAYDDNPPRALAEEWASDGAKRVFTFLFGGLYALIYYAPFALVYEVARWMKWLYSSKTRSRARYALD